MSDKYPANWTGELPWERSLRLWDELEQERKVRRQLAEAARRLLAGEFPNGLVEALAASDALDSERTP